MQQKQETPYIFNHQSVLTLLQFTPISAFLSLAAIILAFVVPPLTPMPFLLLLTPLYINTHSYGLGISLILIAVVWPIDWQSNQIVIRLALVMDALYLMGSNNRNQKYRILPSRVVNSGIPILL